MKLTCAQYFVPILLVVCLLAPLGVVRAVDATNTATNTQSAATNRLKTVGEGTYQSAEGTTPGSYTFPTLLGQIISAFFSLLGVIFIVLIILAGFKWMTAGSEAKKTKEAGESIQRAVLGLVITLAAYAIWKFVFSRLINGV